jgi:hypothetical protein
LPAFWEIGRAPGPLPSAPARAGSCDRNDIWEEWIVAYPRGRRGARLELITARSKVLLRNLIETRNGNERLAMIKAELLAAYNRGAVNGDTRSSRHKGAPGPDSGAE